MIIKRLLYSLAATALPPTGTRRTKYQGVRFTLMDTNHKVMRQGKPAVMAMTHLYKGGIELARIGVLNGKVCNLYVSPLHRNEGWARYMMEHTLSRYSCPLLIEARPYGQKELTATQLADFYATFGFIALPESQQTRVGSIFMLRP